MIFFPNFPTRHCRSKSHWCKSANLIRFLIFFLKTWSNVLVRWNSSVNANDNEKLTKNMEEVKNIKTDNKCVSFSKEREFKIEFWKIFISLSLYSSFNHRSAFESVTFIFISLSFLTPLIVAFLEWFQKLKGLCIFIFNASSSPVHHHHFFK